MSINRCILLSTSASVRFDAAELSPKIEIIRDKLQQDQIPTAKKLYNCKMLLLDHYALAMHIYNFLGTG